MMKGVTNKESKGLNTVDGPVLLRATAGGSLLTAQILFEQKQIEAQFSRSSVSKDGTVYIGIMFPVCTKAGRVVELFPVNFVTKTQQVAPWDISGLSSPRQTARVHTGQPGIALGHGKRQVCLSLEVGLSSPLSPQVEKSFFPTHHTWKFVSKKD